MNRESVPHAMPAVSGLHFDEFVLAAGAPATTGIQGAMARAGVLGGICHGAAPLLAGCDRCDATDGPLQRVPTPLFATVPPSGSVLLRLLCSDHPVQGGSAGSIRYRTDGDFLFGAISSDSPDLTAGETGGLQETSRSLYEQIFGFLGRLEPAHGYRLWRIWNYLSDINESEGGLERYRLFNLGRAQAFADHLATRGGRGSDSGENQGAIPAACGIGLPGPRTGAPALLSISFLAGRHDFAQIENPRQVSAFAYPPDYGPAQPLFSRAILGPAATGVPGRPAPLFVSGTASIVGHRTLHRGDVVEQCRESLRNIQAVLRQANDSLRARGEAPMAMEDLNYLVYLRAPHDLAAVRQVVDAALGARGRVQYVQADICRDDLLVEIEATRLSPPPQG